MNAAVPLAQISDLMSVLSPGDCLSLERARGATAYRLLTGCDVEAACIEQDQAFDRHVFASLLAVAASEGGVIGDRVGLADEDLADLMERWFPQALDVFERSRPTEFAPEDDEISMVRDLLLANRSTDGEDSRWLAFMIARRALESNHLWEDLGLRDRTELSRLLTRHFASLSTRNLKNMRWKRFFYRMLCESDGFVMCSTPVCTNCCDFNLCFGEENGESRLANARRKLALEAETVLGTIGARAS
jgi:nitrogen fixation protein NifQ